MGTARSMGVALGAAPLAISDEAVLVAELKAGSEEAFAYLLRAYQNPVFNLVAHIVEPGTEPADVLQDVFVKIFKGIRSFHGDSSLRTWVYRIAVHEALNHRRSWLRRLRREAFSLDDPEGPGMDKVSAKEIQGGTPYEALEQSERHQLVRRALASLAEPYRAVVVLREIEELSYEEIAEVLGVAEGTVKSRLVRGRDLLRRKLMNGFAR